MKKMLLPFTILSLFWSCKKETLNENYLPGTWSLAVYKLFENDTLKATSSPDESSIIYYFAGCETSSNNVCDMYIEEDGEQTYYTYIYDESTNTLLVGESSVFEVVSVNSKELELERKYENYRSTYRFLKGD